MSGRLGFWGSSTTTTTTTTTNTGKARNQGTTQTSHIGQCTHVFSGSTNVKVQNT